jgi:Flp pilus assembly secretin CpaC
VQTDLTLLRERLKHVAPKDEIEVQAAQDAIILTGTSSSEQVMAVALEVASVFVPKGKVISLLSVTDVKPQQVLASPRGGGHARALKAGIQHAGPRRYPAGRGDPGQRLLRVWGASARWPRGDYPTCRG